MSFVSLYIELFANLMLMMTNMRKNWRHWVHTKYIWWDLTKEEVPYQENMIHNIIIFPLLKLYILLMNPNFFFFFEENLSVFHLFISLRKVFVKIHLFNLLWSILILVWKVKTQHNQVCVETNCWTAIKEI